MTLIYSVILCLFFKARICQLQCVKETLDDTEFSINVTTHFEIESGDCLSIPYEFTLPTNKVTAPYRKIWFKGDPQNTISVEIVDTVESEMKGTFNIDGLPRGEYEYGFKLEWECNQMYIFPKRVRISVSALTKTPDVKVSPMTEGQRATLQCAARLCSDRDTIYWNLTKGGGRSLHVNDGIFNSLIGASILDVTPTADDHNTNITCVADYGHSVVETTVTLNVKFSPKILNSSQCMVEGKFLVCVCISRGNPLAPITWPSLTDFSVTSSSSIQTVNSTFTMPAADYHNTSVKCISSNELGRAEIDIPLQNETENFRPNYELESNHNCDAVLPWIIAGVSLNVNLLLLTSLIICTYKRCRAKSQQRELAEEMNTYASLNQADVGQDYSVISPRTRGVSRKGPGVARAAPEI